MNLTELNTIFNYLDTTMFREGPELKFIINEYAQVEADLSEKQHDFLKAALERQDEYDKAFCTTTDTVLNQRMKDAIFLNRIVLDQGEVLYWMTLIF